MQLLARRQWSVCQNINYLDYLLLHNTLWNSGFKLECFNASQFSGLASWARPVCDGLSLLPVVCSQSAGRGGFHLPHTGDWRLPEAFGVGTPFPSHVTTPAG